jgi:CBS domain-containing protein
LLKLVANPDADGGSLTVADIMHKEPVTVSPETPTLEALTLMKERNIGSLPVVEQGNRLVGLITVYDLLDISAKVLEDFLRNEDSTPGSG